MLVLSYFAINNIKKQQNKIDICEIKNDSLIKEISTLNNKISSLENYVQSSCSKQQQSQHRLLTVVNHFQNPNRAPLRPVWWSA